MSDLKFDDYTLELAQALGFTCEIDGEFYRLEGHGIVCTDRAEHSIYVFLNGYRLGKLSCEFSEDWALRDMG